MPSAASNGPVPAPAAAPVPAPAAAVHAQAAPAPVLAPREPVPRPYENDRPFLQYTLAEVSLQGGHSSGHSSMIFTGRNDRGTGKAQGSGDFDDFALAADISTPPTSPFASFCFTIFFCLVCIGSCAQLLRRQTGCLLCILQPHNTPAAHTHFCTIMLIQWVPSCLPNCLRCHPPDC